MNSMFITGISAIDKAVKKAVILSIFMQVHEKYKKVALFQPIAQDEHGKLAKEDTGFDYERVVIYTLAEARELINKGQINTLMETIIRKYKETVANADFVLCEGVCLGDKEAYFRLNLNVDIASTLAAPLICLKNCEGMAIDEITSSSASKIEQIHMKGASILANILLYFDSSDEKIIADRINQITPCLINSLPTSACNLIESDKDKFVKEESKKHINFADITKALSNVDQEKKTPLMFEFELMEKARSKTMRIVLAEGEEDRVLKATDILLARKVADIILIGDQAKIDAKAKELGLDIAKATIINPSQSPDYEDFAQTYAELRKAKGITIDQAREKMLDCTYFATMMVHKDLADGMVSGAVNTTAHTVRPALEFIKTKPEYSTVSGVFFMCLKDRVFTFGDCAINLNPNPEQLAEIAINAADTAKTFGIQPRVAMISYSTGDSGKGIDVEAVIEATKIAREKAPHLPLEGPIQYDAAIDLDVAKTKLPNSDVAGRATVFIFPDLNTGNSCYKAVQRAANAIAIGPVLQGLNKPVNDLSRGCTVPDIVNTVAITAVQAQNK